MRPRHLSQTVTRLLGSIAVAAPLWLHSSEAFAQSTSACRAADSISTKLQADIVEIVTASDSVGMAFRDSLGLPAVPTSDVALVSNSKTCQSAAQAYRSNAIENKASLSDRVYVFSVGRTRFVVLDPAYYPVVVGDRIRMTFTSKWEFRRRY